MPRGEFAIEESLCVTHCRTHGENCTLHEIELFTRPNHPSIPKTSGLSIRPQGCSRVPLFCFSGGEQNGHRVAQVWAACVGRLRQGAVASGFDVCVSARGEERRRARGSARAAPSRRRARPLAAQSREWIAQRLARLTADQQVPGSNPGAPFVSDAVARCVAQASTGEWTQDLEFTRLTLCR